MSSPKEIRPIPWWKKGLSLIIALAVLYAATLLFSRATRPDTTTKPMEWSQAEIDHAIEVRKPLSAEDPPLVITKDIPESEQALSAEFYKNHPRATKDEVEKAIAAGKLPAWYPRGESPLLAELVEKGELPPVAERVGPEPVVLSGVDGIGTYGGVWQQLMAGSFSECDVVTNRINYARLFRFSPYGEPIVPHIAKKLEIKDGGKIWEITLRKIRWSDGHPLTTEDIRYLWFDVMLDKEIGSELPWRELRIKGQPADLKIIDEHTFQIIFPSPNGVFMQVLAFSNYLVPSHYMRKFHPRYADPMFLAEQMKKYALPTKYAVYWMMNSFDNPEKPTMNAWMRREYRTITPFSWVRNPYYYAVDEQGNQLPYIDRLQLEQVDPLMVPLSVSTGRSAMQFRYITFSNYSEFMAQTGKHNCEVYCWVSASISDWLLYPNLNRATPEGDKQAEHKAKLLFRKEFRQALSIGVDRKPILDAFYLGQGDMAQIDPGIYSDYPSEKLRHAWVKYDPERANQMLDDLWREFGWDPDRRVRGMRCGPDGKPLTFYLYLNSSFPVAPAQFLAEDWAKLGIRLVYQSVSRALLDNIRLARTFDFYVWSSESDMLPLLSSRCFAVTNSDAASAVGWARWYVGGGMYGHRYSKNPGCIPVPQDHPMYAALQYFENAVGSVKLEDRQQWMEKITDIASENLWVINLVANAPRVIVVSKDMHNVPKKAMDCFYMFTPGNAAPETWYLGNPSHAADEDTLRQIRAADPLPRRDGMTADGAQKSSLPQVLILIIAGLFVVLLILRHPFVLRRLLIMVPTLLVVSICVFTIVQLPPGDFLTNRIMQMRESGASEESIEQNIRQLQEIFRFEDPAWLRYCNWMGFTYLVTFDEKNTGLLQGNMGYSMETQKPVNNMVGDRIWLTMLISAGTVLLTWSLALPIGIYSACKQYSPGDYFFTILGFLGMCMPSFLLALILMALTGISGLFSGEFMIQPHWDWPKVQDMLTHIWVPVLVVGVSGTAGMIRVMRANLLDELRKPYVTTARAKGVRPLKLLLKYPVRLALNPFISGIGGIFPSLVSGSSIVAIVMSLPTVGPLMLTALFSQDMNMAGSMLMVLSTLGVIGTLISDLLLMVVDPRIRIGGNTR